VRPAAAVRCNSVCLYGYKNKKNAQSASLCTWLEQRAMNEKIKPQRLTDNHMQKAIQHKFFVGVL
jgi:hypothetical protein